MAKLDDRFQRLCNEAVLACGEDLTAVEAYVSQRMESMDAADRETMKQDIHRVLAFRPPSKPDHRLH